MKKLKLLSLLLILSLSLVLSGCMVVEKNGDTSSSGGSYEVVVTTTTGNEALYTSLTDMLDDVRPSVVEVYTQSSTSIGTGAGSGIILSVRVDDRKTQNTADDITYYYVLTCHHVIDASDSIMVKDIDGNEFNASLIGGDPQSDIAVLLIATNVSTKSNLKVAKVRTEQSSTTPLKVGEEVVAIGNPLGTLGGTVTKGIISSTNRTVNVEGESMNLIQTDCSINSGNSGGGLFDTQGNLVGVVNAGYVGLQGLNFAIPVDDAVSVYTELLETYFYNSPYSYNYGYVKGRARVSAEYAYNLSFGYDIAIADYSSGFFDYAPYVMQVKKNSIYDKVGIRAGDVIRKVSFKEETYTFSGACSASLVDYLQSLKVEIGDTLKITVLRANAEQTFTVKFEQFVYGDTYLRKS